MAKHNNELELLETFAPILKFSSGERFFPMNVQDYIEDTKLYKEEDKDFVAEGKNLTNGNLGNYGHEYYLQYIPSKTFFEKIIWRDLLLMILIIITIMVGIQTEQIPEFADDIKLTQVDYRKIGFLFGIALAGVILQGRRVIYFSFAFFFTALFYYGHIVGIGLGYLSVLGLIFLGTVRWYSTRRFAKKQSEFSVTYWPGRDVLVYDEFVAFGLGLLVTFMAGFLTFWFGFPRLGYDPSLPIQLPLTNLVLPQWIVLLALMISGPIITAGFWKWLEIVATTISSTYLILIILFHDSWMSFDSILRTMISALVMIICILMALKLLKLFDRKQTPRFQEALKSLVQSTKPKNLSNRALALMLAWIAFWWIGTFISFELFSNMQWITPRTIVIYPMVYLLIYLIAMLILVLIGIVLNGGDLIRWYMDLRSSASDAVADEAWEKYNKSREKYKNTQEKREYFYYGHVVTDKEWTSLQYHFFYAFNDWRSNADGLNHHEGDWEAVAVFLETINPHATDIIKRYKPFGVAISQHEDGEFRFWNDDINDDKKFEKDGLHPVIYPAKGSHANYFEADEYSTAFQFTGLLRRIVGFVDRLMREFNNNLGMEIADGDGEEVAIRYTEIVLVEKVKSYLIDYGGLWGRKTQEKHESGPLGPKLDGWEKKNGKTKPIIRPRWKLHEWKDRLLFKILHDSEIDIEKRRRALLHLINR